MIQLFVAVRYKNGRKKKRKFESQDGPATGAECPLRLTSVLCKVVAALGSLHKNCKRYDKVTCQKSSLREIVEIVVEIKVLRYLLLTMQPGNLLSMSNWKYTGQLFNFDSVTYGGLRLPRAFPWNSQRPNGPYTI